MRFLIAFFLIFCVTSASFGAIDINVDTKGVLGRTKGGTGVNSPNPFAQTGADINGSFQITSTHLAGTTNNTLMRSNSSGNMVNSQCTDDLTTLTCTGSGGLVTPQVTTNGSAADIYGNIVAPATAPTGQEYVWTDSTDHRLHDKNEAGSIGTTVVANAGTTHQFFSSLNSAGVLVSSQPSFNDLQDYRSQDPPIVETCGGTSTCAHSLPSNPIIIMDTVALVGGTVTVGPFLPAFTSASSYHCIPVDFSTPTNGAKITGATANSITITGTGADIIQYVCIGN